MKISKSSIIPRKISLQAPWVHHRNYTKTKCLCNLQIEVHTVKYLQKLSSSIKQSQLKSKHTPVSIQCIEKEPIGTEIYQQSS